MLIDIDFQSEEAIYVQLMNQIIMAIACQKLKEGDSLPPVRQLAAEVGINMHTVNKAYSLLRTQGIVTIDRRRGAVIAVDDDYVPELERMKEALRPILARASCHGISAEKVHALVDEVMSEWRQETEQAGEE